MLKIDLENCTGCGTCLEVCPVEAISLLSGKAVIDYEFCNSCLECAQVCPAEAIFPIDLPLPAEVLPSSSKSLQRVSPPAHQLSQELTPWLGTMLSVVGRELLPRIVDTLVLALERRLERSTQNMPNHYPSEMQGCGGRQRRRRRHVGRNLSINTRPKLFKYE